MNVLIVKTSSLGDIVHTFAALTDAKKNISEICFDWVVEESFVEVPAWHPAVENVIPISLRRWRKNIIKAIFSGEIFNFFKQLRQKKYDLIIDAQGLIKSAIISKIASGVRCGYDKNSIREKQATFFYDKVFVVEKNQHAIARTCHLFAYALNYKVSDNIPNYGIDIMNSDSYEKYVIFLHGTSRKEKCWSEQKWIDLANIAIRDNFIVYLFWYTKEELARAKRILKSNSSKIKILPKLSLLEAANLIKGAKAIVSVDTGLGHIAAALGTFNVSLYGPTNPKLSGTFGKKQFPQA